MANKEKKTEQLLVRLTPSQAERVKAVADEPVALARQVLMEEVSRREAAAGKPLSPVHARVDELLRTVPAEQVLGKLNEIAQEAAAEAAGA